MAIDQLQAQRGGEEGPTRRLVFHCSPLCRCLAVANVVHDDMEHPEAFQAVTVWAFGACWAFYSVFAVLGYL